MGKYGTNGVVVAALRTDEMKIEKKKKKKNWKLSISKQKKKKLYS